MYRDQADLDLLAELAGVLDQTVTAAGLSAGQYLVLRELVRDEGPVPVTALAERLKAAPDEVAEVAGRLVTAGLAEVRPNGLAGTPDGIAKAEAVDTEANEAIRAYVLERPHTATVYGLVASMQSGRFTVEDLLEFLSESAEAAEAED